MAGTAQEAVLVATILHKKAKLTKKTARVDGVVPALAKLFGLRSVIKFAEIVTIEYEKWPQEGK